MATNRARIERALRVDITIARARLLTNLSTMAPKTKLNIRGSADMPSAKPARTGDLVNKSAIQSIASWNPEVPALEIALL